MPAITFRPSGIIIDAQPGTPLFDVAKEAGVSVEIPCGGNGLCGKCLVRIESGKIDFDNNGVLSEELIQRGMVLFCKSKVSDEPAVIQVFSNLDKERGKFAEMMKDMNLIDSSLFPLSEDISPIVKKAVVHLEKANVGDGLSDYDRLKDAMESALGASDIELPVAILRELPLLAREKDGEITVAYYEKSGSFRIADIESGDTISVNYGVAVDIGTTTIAVQLVDMTDSRILSNKTDYNGQIECGLDIISRINYGLKPQRLEELRVKVLKTINKIIDKLLEESGIDRKYVYNASIAGNTTMMALLFGIYPEHIRLDPYTPPIYYVPLYTASELELNISPYSAVYIAPSVGSYVGGDITSGILCTSLATDSDELVLFVDIGTNGELVIGNNEFMMACACSAGPAFEGGGITCGMRASIGAIEKVEVDPNTGVCSYNVIGDGKPTGICGSGMISLLSELLKHGWIDPAGRFDRSRTCGRIQFSGKSAKYIIAPEDESGTGNAIYVIESDVDNIVRAKAAIFSACRLMLNSVSMDFSDLTKMYIAGGFGRYLNIENAQAIGLIPNLSADRFSFLGNSSIVGAYMTLISEKHRALENTLANKITYLDLSVEPGYMDQYTAALFLPHTDASLFK